MVDTILSQIIELITQQGLGWIATLFIIKQWTQSHIKMTRVFRLDNPTTLLSIKQWNNFLVMMTKVLSNSNKIYQNDIR